MTNIDLTEEELAIINDRRSHATPSNPEARGYPPPDEDRQFGEAPRPNPATVTRLIPATEWVSKQVGNLQAVGETNYRAGITRPKKDPIQAGIAAQPAYEAAMRDPATLKRRESGLRRTNMDEWSSMSERVGARRLVEGVVERRYKVERFVGSFQPKLAAHLQHIDALPAVTDADRERKMVENLKGLRALKGTAG
jgi:hypothetical protein